jgi:LCP family protein required for cell wall assembly
MLENGPPDEAADVEPGVVPGGPHPVKVVRIPSHGEAPTATQPFQQKGTTEPLRKERKPWTAGRVVRWTAGITGLLTLAVVVWVVVLFVQLQGRIYVPLPPTPTAPVALATSTPGMAGGGSGEATVVAAASPTRDMIKALPAGRFNILVLGTDKRPNDPGTYARSDTMLLVNVDTISNTVRIMAIPRDLTVDIPDYGTNKVNAAYFFGEYYKVPGGGQALAVETLSQFFNVPIEYYVAINFQGFEKVVDAVGGVDVNVPYSIDDYNYPTDEQGNLYGTMHVHFDAGLQHMDGQRALEYARTRHADNDFARSKRQLQIILAVRQKAMSLNLLPSLPALTDALGGMVETNIPLDRQIGLAQLGYNIDASSIVTSAIDSTMISPVTLSDGSEGLKLDKEAAQPVIDRFFGWAASGSDVGSDNSTAPDAQGTASAGVKETPLPVDTRVPTRRKP